MTVEGMLSNKAHKDVVFEGQRRFYRYNLSGLDPRVSAFIKDARVGLTFMPSIDVPELLSQLPRKQVRDLKRFTLAQMAVNMEGMPPEDILHRLEKIVSRRQTEEDKKNWSKN